MFELDQYSLMLPTMQKDLLELKGNLDIEGMSYKVEELENKASEPEFWNDAKKSQEVLKELNMLKSKLGKI